MINLLKALGDKISNDLGHDVQYGQIPDTPNNIVVLNFYEGNYPVRMLGNSKMSIREPRLQMYVRNESYASATTVISECAELLNSVSGFTGGKYVTKISQNGEMFYLGRLMKQRDEFTMNFTIQIDNEKEE